jgi:hypothetical protein
MAKPIYNSLIQSKSTVDNWFTAWMAGCDLQEDDVAVTVVKKPLGMSGLALVEKILTSDEDKALLHAFTAKGGLVMLSATAFKFVLGPHSLPVPITLEQLTKLNSDHPPQDVMAGFDIMLSAALVQTVDWKSSGTSVLDKLPPQEPAPAKVVTHTPTGMWDTFPVEKMAKGVRVSLYQADKLYQPVYGTSSNSRYYLVAGNEEIKVAARYCDGSLSVRIEGPQLNKHLHRVKEVGFDQKPGDQKPYASIHLSVTNDVVAAKALGALLLGLGVELRTKMPDIKVLKGK